MTYAVVDLRARTMTYARAGHTPLIYVPGGAAPDGDGRRRRCSRRTAWCSGLKLDDGEMFERLLEEQTIPLHAGDLYLLFTDGISEAMNAPTTVSASRASAGSSRSTRTCRPTSCASASCARSRRSSATRRSTTT